MARSVSQSRRTWPRVAARTALAIMGGYAFTYAFTAALARLLPVNPVDASTIASLLSFVVFLLFILWAFSTVSVRRVLLGLSMTLPLVAVGFWPQLLEALR
ncbi:iron transporter [Stutzerimonas stutzeri]|uniref:iron transporter n=1 Tax=Stutzerimonas stutzeri TaxID=316 RepID=UPI00371292B6